MVGCIQRFLMILHQRNPDVVKNPDVKIRAGNLDFQLGLRKFFGSGEASTSKEPGCINPKRNLDFRSTPKEPGFGVPQKEPGFWTPKRDLDFWPREIQNWTVSGSPQRNLDVGSTPKEPGCFRGQFPQKSQFPRKIDPKHAPDPQKHPTFREISPLLQLWT